MPTIKTKRATIYVRLPERSKRRIEQLAGELQRTINSIILQAVDALLADPPHNVTMRAATRAAKRVRR